MTRLTPNSITLSARRTLSLLLLAAAALALPGCWGGFVVFDDCHEHHGHYHGGHCR